MDGTLGMPVPELPVADVLRAQEHYRDALGCEINWLEPDGGIGAVSRGRFTVFFRRREAGFEPAVHWLFVEDLDAVYAEFAGRSALVDGPPEVKPWGIRQFTLKDVDGNVFYVHA